MTKQERAIVNHKGKSGSVKASISIISFKEGSNYIVYSPHLEVSGYGETEDEAKQSFTVSMSVFLDYTTKKKTLHNELIALGWKLKKGTAKRPKEIKAPTWKELLENNPQFEELLATHKITASHKSVRRSML